MSLREIEKLDESYVRHDGVVFMTGLQALVRVLLVQHRLDTAAGLNTAGFVSGYRGSPLGGLDRELWRARQHLEAANVRFEPGLNEDLAATSIWGSQQTHLFPGARYDGVYSLWYGKGPGVDRSGDALKHGNAAGASRYGGVLVAAGDDHACKSSSLPHQSEFGFVDAMIPVLNPCDVQELIHYGLLGFAMSRFSGCWAGLIIVQDTADATQTVALTSDQLRIVTPEFNMPPGGLNIRWPDPPIEQEFRLHRYRLDAARAFAAANHFDREVLTSKRRRYGIITTGKAHLDTMQALEHLGIDMARARELGIVIYKVGMSWPLESDGIARFAHGLEEVLVVEEKRGLIEDQLKEQLYNKRGPDWPIIVGKHDEQGRALVASTGELRPSAVARAIARRLVRYPEFADLADRVAMLDARENETQARATTVTRLPHFCSGCPHNTSTRVPEGSRAIAGIGCHYMAGWMDRNTATFSQMGGEGATWIGQAPFTETEHVFQNMGDGTYAHSGVLAIRAAVAADINITFKILFNDAVAMTGGQPVEGQLTVPNMVGQLQAEGVKPIYVLSDHPEKYRGASSLPAGVEVRDRREIEIVQKHLRECAGVSVLIFDQTCATELHRKRKRGLVAAPERRVVINDLVCEGCGDCNVQSNCLSVVSYETEFGRKRHINQSACNQDYSCLEGFCPSFVTLKGAERNPARPLASESVPSLPAPQRVDAGAVHNVLIVGIGGTGVVTASGLIGLAAHLEGRSVLQLDQTGLAQKFGAVLSHVRIADSREAMHTSRIPAGQVDLLLGADLMVAAGQETLSMLADDRSKAVVNTHAEMPSDFILDRDFRFPADEMLTAIEKSSREVFTLDATHLADALLGDNIGANIFMLGFAFQRGLLPLSGEALYRALELYAVNVEGNKQAFNWGRFAAHSPEIVADLLNDSRSSEKPATELSAIVARRAAWLRDYQDQAYAQRYRDRVSEIDALERRVAPDSRRLVTAVARNLFKLLAYKDEYEVARLHTQTGFLEGLKKHFRNDFKTEFHFSPPFFARKDPTTGRPRKYRVGPWILPVLRLLARMRSLRGGPFDVFGYTRERRLERRLIADYESLLDRFAKELTKERLETAVALAELPESIRGFGPIKSASVEVADARRAELLAEWDRPPAESRP
ncbi:MAG: indolepyruvate ferredoxin oxidoreductase family protein, partial [Gammaproteobacteria bacterium]